MPFDDADLLVSSYLFPMNRGMADRKGVPFASFAFAHQAVPSPDYPPENLALPAWFPRPLRRLWNRALWRVGNVAVDTIINGTVAAPLRATGLPKVRNFFSEPANLVLVAVSESVMLLVPARKCTRDFVSPATAAGRRRRTLRSTRK